MLAAEIIVQVDQSQQVVSAGGELLPDLTLDVIPQVTPDHARLQAFAKVSKEYRVDPAGLTGYGREEHTHLAVAAAVAAGSADTGLGILAAARAFGLDFVPIAQEPYDLVLRADGLADPLIAALWTLLEQPDFRSAIEALGGYSCAETGRRIR